MAAAARSCERAAYSSSCVRLKPHLSAIISAPMPWLKSSTPYRSSTVRPYGSPNFRAEPMGTRFIVSTPPAMIISLRPDMTAYAANSNACWLEPQARLMVTAGTVSGQPAASTAKRPTLLDWSPNWVTQPQ
jgi:hypothetical protein